MARGRAVSTTQVRRPGRSVLTVSHATGTAIATEAAVTAPARRLVRTSSWIVRVPVAISTIRSRPASEPRMRR